MKNTFLFTLLFIIQSVQAQNNWNYAIEELPHYTMSPDTMIVDFDDLQDSLDVWYKNAQDSLSNICKERGHVKSDLIFTTSMHDEPYILDEDSVSYKVYPGGNVNAYKCLRCGQAFTEQEPERREIIWRKH